MKHEMMSVRLLPEHCAWLRRRALERTLKSGGARPDVSGVLRGILDHAMTPPAPAKRRKRT